MSAENSHETSGTAAASKPSRLTKPSRPRVFLSYDGEAKEIATAFRAQIEAFAVSYDMQYDNRPGDKWADNVNKELQAAEAVVLLVSPKANRSPWVQSEVNLARRYCRTPVFVPVSVNGTQPEGGLALLLSDKQIKDINVEDNTGITDDEAEKIREVVDFVTAELKMKKRRKPCTATENREIRMLASAAHSSLSAIRPQLEEKCCVLIAAPEAEEEAKAVSEYLRDRRIRVHVGHELHANSPAVSLFDTLHALFTQAGLAVMVGDFSSPDPYLR